MAEPPSSPPSDFTSIDDAVAWYKSQYEQLELELQDFRASSGELEAELEKDIEEKERNEALLKGKVESLGFEVEEWKGKYKQSKVEANNAQNALEKEITTLRDSNRTLQLKLRDIEVANDDFERQARNTTSSLEDLESKYNVAIERTVMLEEEIKLGEQEREKLRIEAQHLREELSDLKVEADILQDKIKKQESRHLSTISTDISVPDSPTFDNSTGSTASSPIISTPPDSKATSTADTVSEMQDPPSPPMSEASVPLPNSSIRTPAPTRKSRLPSADQSVTPKPPKNFSSSLSRPSGTRAATHNIATRTPAPRAAPRATSHKIPTSNSLSHIRSLTAQMQRLEARVQNARSKLPAPSSTPPRFSPRSSLQGGAVPSTITIRSRKRTVGASSVASSAADDQTPTAQRSHVPRLSTSGVGRLSFGPLPNRDPTSTGASDASMSRPSSRASVTSYQRPASRTDMVPPPRPMSRTSMSGVRTPMGPPRPRSSLGGSIHGHSMSVTDIDEEPMQTPSRRGTFADGVSGIPAPRAIPVPRRQSGGPTIGHQKRASSAAARKLADLGETY